VPTAFEVTEDDVAWVLGDLGLANDDDATNSVFARLDKMACEWAALRGSEIDDQTAGAYAEIRRQIEGFRLAPNP
jgi:hypothetical protein